MINEARLEKFRQVVENKFQIYNSLFMSLPYDKMTNIGMLLPFLYEESRDGYEEGKSPEKIVEEFFKKHTEVTTEEQKQEFLPQILNGKMRWCQGFSEPNSGSDLASLKTTAVLDGDEWVINGQKVWTTGGHHADYCFLLTRTDTTGVKHAGITYLLVPMRQPGVEVRGIVQPDGTAEFCEVFFTDARCSKNNVVGASSTITP